MAEEVAKVRPFEVNGKTESRTVTRTMDVCVARFSLSTNQVDEAVREYVLKHMTKDEQKWFSTVNVEADVGYESLHGYDVELIGEGA